MSNRSPQAKRPLIKSIILGLLISFLGLIIIAAAAIAAAYIYYEPEPSEPRGCLRFVISDYAR